MKKFFIVFIIMLFIGVIIMSCNPNNSSQNHSSAVDIDSLVNAKVEERLKEKENFDSNKNINQESEINQESGINQVENSIVGTFEITEEGRGNVRTIVLTVNDDETATMRYKDSEFIHYGSWYKYNHMKYAKFHFVEEDNFATSHSTIPHLCFDVVNNRELSNFVLMDGYLYSSSSAADAKNPKERLKLKRVSSNNNVNVEDRAMSQERNLTQSSQIAYFIIIASSTSLNEAKKKANSISGLVVKGFAKGSTRYRICYGMYSSKQEAESHLNEAKNRFNDQAWILTENSDAVVYP